MSRSWYSYTSGNPLLASSYRLSSDKPGCLLGFTVCSIYSPNGGAFPTSPLSSNIQRYIADGLSNGVPEPQAPANARKYVYMKTVA